MISHNFVFATLETSKLHLVVNIYCFNICKYAIKGSTPDNLILFNLNHLCVHPICLIWNLLFHLQLFHHLIGLFLKRFFSYRKSAIASVLSGAISQFLASPTDLVKVRMMMEGKRKLQGLTPRFIMFYHFYENALHDKWNYCFIYCSKKIKVS